MVDTGGLLQVLGRRGKRGEGRIGEGIIEASRLLLLWRVLLLVLGLRLRGLLQEGRDGDGC